MELSQKTLNESNLLSDFGSKSTLAKNTVLRFHEFLIKTDQGSLKSRAEEGNQVLLRAYQLDSDIQSELARHYTISEENVNFVLFGIQTYFSLLVKLIAAEVVHHHINDQNQSSYMKLLMKVYSEDPLKLKNYIEEIENGKFFQRVIRVKNLCEGSNFSWYLAEWTGELAEVVFSIASRIAEYNLNLDYTSTWIKDCFKPIYLELIPKSVRSKLGEFYTPRWLVQFLLDKIGYNLEAFQDFVSSEADPIKPIQLRVIDPSCGSGSFLLEVLARIRFYAKKHGLENQLRSAILENIVGVDLNPLAVLAARTNYLLSILDLIPAENEIEVPIYLTDAVSFERSEILASLGEFDYLIGNPPWLLWENLPEEYRKRIKPLWDKYGLFTLKGYDTQHGGGKKDFSVLFTYTCLDRYLKQSGMLSFILTRSVFKTIGAGEGFRKFSLKKRAFRVIEVHDFSEIRPFEETHSKTTLLLLEGDKETSYPVDYVIWKRKTKFNKKSSWSNVSRAIYPIRLVAIPSISTNLLSPWITVPIEILQIIKKIYGRSDYSSKEGINSGGLNGVFWVEPLKVLKTTVSSIPIRNDLASLNINQETSRVLAIHNVTKGMKKKVPKVFTQVEDFFVYPLLKSRNVEKWRINKYNYALQMQDPIKRKGYGEDWVRTNFPLTYAYLTTFKAELQSRKSKVVRQLIERGPFYSMYAVGEYTYSRFKVVWSQMGKKLKACVISRIHDMYLGNKLVLPEHVLAFIPVEDEFEAHYICAILNSTVANLLLGAIARGTKSFGTPRLVDKTMRIFKFNPSSQLQMKLARLSLEAHRLAQIGSEELVDIEKQIDLGIADLYGIELEEYLVIQRSLELLT
ncbi:MAG: Eco57I restriction-modification methylase domain-containing protein [Candidatus Heimdallarchaeota archaeon]